MQTLTFEILGIPQPKQSARFRISKNKAGKQFVQSYQKKSVVDNEANLGWSVVQQLPQGFIPFDCAIGVEVEYVFPIPKSFSQKLKIAISRGLKFYKETKPDLTDNLNKGLFDALSGIVYVNDSRIATIKAEKYYGVIPKIVIRFNTID